MKRNTRLKINIHGEKETCRRKKKHPEKKHVEGNKKKTSIGKETPRWKINIDGEKETCRRKKKHPFLK
jgi:hypothetical protein